VAALVRLNKTPHPSGQLQLLHVPEDRVVVAVGEHLQVISSSHPVPVRQVKEIRAVLVLERRT
jgi:hypothetical protein